MTSSRRPVATGLAMALVSCLTVPAGAAEPPPSRAMLACAQEADSTRRLACYDRELLRQIGAALSDVSQAATAAAATEAAPAAPAAPVAPVAPAPQAAPAAPMPGAAAPAPVAATVPVPAPAAAATPRGFGDEQIARRSRSKEEREEAERALTAGITGLKEYRIGAYLITLDNGQTWRQEEIESYFPLKVGDTVRIERGLMGSYHLTRVAEGWKKRTRVKRVR